jgi:hypothetical protein
MRAYMLTRRFLPLIIALPISSYAVDAMQPNSEICATYMAAKPLHTIQPNTSQCTFKTRNAVGLMVTADYLFWQAQEDQLVYAIRFSDLPSLGVPQQTRPLEQEFEWSSGYRVGVGYQYPKEHWSLYLNWTHFSAHPTSHFCSPMVSLFASALAGATNDSPISLGMDAKSQWHLHLDMLDLELGRTWTIGSKFSIQPHLGVKGGWIDQEQKITYTQLTGLKDLDIPKAQVKRENDFAGIGPRGGVNLRWGKEFGIFGNLSAALLYGAFDVDAKYNIISDPASQNGTISNNEHRLRPTAQLSLGFDWTHHFKSEQTLSIKAGYETQYWWDQWHVIPNLLSTELLSTSPYGDLSFHGLTLSAAVLF